MNEQTNDTLSVFSYHRKLYIHNETTKIGFSIGVFNVSLKILYNQLQNYAPISKPTILIKTTLPTTQNVM